MDIQSATLSIEVAGFDPSANSNSVRNWGFTMTGADSNADRTTGIRASFAHFADVSAALTPGQLARFGSPSRRRLVILQGVDGGRDSSGNAITQWQVLYNTGLEDGDFSASDDTAFQAAINSVFPAPTAVTFADWAISENLPAALNGAFDDADGDGEINIKEFYFATSPTNSDEKDRPVVMPVGGGSSGHQITFRRAKNITGVSMKLTTSLNLNQWTEITMDSSNTSVTDMGSYEQVVVSLPALVAGEVGRYFRIEITPSP